LRITNTKLNDEYTSLLDRKNLVSNQINELNTSLQTLEKQSKDAADLFYEKNMALAS
jgi:predicted  nucleic acid-binding Zn-ribbon protein